MTTRLIRQTMLAAVLVAVCAAPAAAVDKETQQMMADIRMLQEQQAQLQQMLATLGDALKQLNSRLDDQSGVVRKAFADSKVQIDNLAGDIRIVREKMDENNVRLSSLSQEVDALRTAMPVPGAAPVPAADATPAPAGPPANSASAAPPAPVAGQTPQRLWDSTYNDYAMAQYPLAIQGFEAYIRYYPKSDQADDAQFYIGESYFNSSKWSDAVAAYARVIADYPGGNQVPNAYYKQGRALENLQGQMDQAKQAYQTVIDKFPDSQAATLAKQRLEGLNRPAR